MEPLSRYGDEEHPGVNDASQKTRQGRRNQPIQAASGLGYQSDATTATMTAVIVLGENLSMYRATP